MVVGADACIRPLNLALPQNTTGGYRIRPDGNRRLHSAPEGSIGRGRKGVKKNAALRHFLAFAFSDYNFGVPKGTTGGSMTLIRGTGRKVAGDGSYPFNPTIPKNPI